MQLDLFTPKPDTPAIPSAAAIIRAVQETCALLFALRLDDTIARLQGRWYEAREAASAILRPVLRAKHQHEAKRANASTLERRTLGRLINDAVILEHEVFGLVEGNWHRAYTAFTDAALAGLSEESVSWLHEAFCQARACDQFGEHTIAQLVAEMAAQDELALAA